MRIDRKVNGQVTRLFRFMLVFGIDRFQILSATEREISAIVGWPDEGQPHYDPDEEVQEILWVVQDIPLIDDVLSVLEGLYEDNLFDMDKILLSESELFERLGVPKEKFDQLIDDILSLRVDMIDGGRKTDSYFVHF